MSAQYQKLLPALLAFLLLFAACKKRIPVQIEKLNDNQFVPLNAQLPQPIQIKAVNHKNEPIKGLEVRFFTKNTSSGILQGNVYEVLDTTDENGIAECIWIFGYENIPQQVEAVVEKYEGESVVFTANPEYFQDPRDGSQYLLAKIGDKVWMAQNLRFTGANSILNPDYPSSVYGRLYTWNNALSACPVGFHLPSSYEFNTIIDAVGNEFNTIGRKLKSRTGWKFSNEGKNLFGFNIYPAGNYNPAMSDFRGLGEYAAFWTMDEVDALNAQYYILAYNSDNLLSAYYEKTTPSACRCVKD